MATRSTASSERKVADLAMPVRTGGSDGLSRPSPIGTRTRSNTSDTYITPRRVSDTRVSVIGEEPIEYNSRSTGVVPGITLRPLSSSPSSARDATSGKTEEVPVQPSEGKSCGEAPAAPGCTFLLRFMLTKDVDWRGERSLFTRGDGGAQSPGVFIVGPFKTLRIRATPGTKPMAAGIARRVPGLAGSRRGASSSSTVVMNSSIERPLVARREVHMAVVLTESEMRYYLDGVLCKSAPMTVHDWNTFASGDLHISRSSHFEGVPCTIRDFDVVSYAMADEEVAKDFGAHSPSQVKGTGAASSA